jgi:hypothetical protein
MRENYVVFVNESVIALFQMAYERNVCSYSCTQEVEDNNNNKVRVLQLLIIILWLVCVM